MWREEWRLAKEFDSTNGGFSARFSTLYEDVRDIMCDSPRPEWDVSHEEKNRRVEVKFGWGSGKRFVSYVGRDEGNRLYMELRRIASEWNPYVQQSRVEKLFGEKEVAI